MCRVAHFHYLGVMGKVLAKRHLYQETVRGPAHKAGPGSVIPFVNRQGPQFQEGDQVLMRRNSQASRSAQVGNSRLVDRQDIEETQRSCAEVSSPGPGSLLQVALYE